MTVLVGQDVKLTAGADVTATMGRARANGLDGVLLRTVLEVTPSVDSGVLADLRATADALQLRLEIGVGKVNPYMTAELPHVRALGDGSYLAGMERMIAACARIGCTELWTATGGYKPEFQVLFANDRFRTDAPWVDQLRATERFLKRLAPVLREHGCHLNLETHEEITTRELVGLIEAVGDDVLGITLDPANLLVRDEDPLAATRRVAPYVRMTHLRDAAVWPVKGGFARFLAPCGEGVIDWPALLDELANAAPLVMLTIEGAWPRRAEMAIPMGLQAWRDADPGLDPAELDAVASLGRWYETRAGAGEVPGLTELRRHDPALTRDDFVRRSARHLRACYPAVTPLPTQGTNR